MNETLTRYFSVGEAISRLFYPFAEVVIHDVKTDTIAAIYNAFSKRKVGDPSLLDKEYDWESKEIFGPYEKANWNGRALKCTASTLKDRYDRTVGVLSIALDLSMWEELHQVLGTFLGQELGERPEAIFKNDWQERINQYVQTYLKEHQKTMDSLNRNDKEDLVLCLYKQGAFKAKHAAQYVANVLGVARATVYNYLKRIGKDFIE